MDPAGAAITAMSTGLGTFGSFLPRLSDVRKTDPMNDAESIRDVRHGEVMAVVVTVGAGIVLTALTKSNVPTYTALAVALGLVLVYETSLRQNIPTDPTETE